MTMPLRRSGRAFTVRGNDRRRRDGQGALRGRSLCQRRGSPTQPDLDEDYATDRHLLYIACTGARDHLLVTGVALASGFLDDLRS